MKIPNEILNKIKKYPDIYKSLQPYLDKDQEDTLSLLFELNSYIKTAFEVQKNHILFTINTLSFAENLSINAKIDEDDLYKYVVTIDEAIEEYDKCILQLTEVIKHNYTKLDVLDSLNGLLCTAHYLFSKTDNKYLFECVLAISEKILDNAE